MPIVCNASNARKDFFKLIDACCNGETAIVTSGNKAVRIISEDKYEAIIKNIAVKTTNIDKPSKGLDFDLERSKEKIISYYGKAIGVSIPDELFSYIKKSKKRKIKEHLDKIEWIQTEGIDFIQFFVEMDGDVGVLGARTEFGLETDRKIYSELVDRFLGGIHKINKENIL